MWIMKVDVRGTEVKQNRQEEAQGKYGLHISMGEMKVLTCTKVAKREDKGQTRFPIGGERATCRGSKLTDSPGRRRPQYPPRETTA